MKSCFAGLIAIGSALVIAACGSEHVNAGVPSAPSAVIGSANGNRAGTTSTTSLLGTWVSRRVLSPASTTLQLSACTNIQMQITSQTATQATGSLSMLCPDNVSVSGTLVGQLGGATIPLTWNGMATQPGFPACAFSLTGTGTPTGPDTFHLTYSGNTCTGPVQGSDDLRLASTAPAPGPGPAPPPGGAVDGINMSLATIRNSPLDLASWPITTALALVEMRPSGVHVEFSKRQGAGRWPDWTPPGWDGGLQYTLGMALNIGGQWYASAPIEFWSGLQEAGGPPQDYALNWFYDPGRWAPMTGHQPAVGEQIGIFVCAGDCRNRSDGSGSPVKERSNVVLVPMPGPGGAIYTF